MKAGIRFAPMTISLECSFAFEVDDTILTLMTMALSPADEAKIIASGSPESSRDENLDMLNTMQQLTFFLPTSLSLGVYEDAGTDEKGNPIPTIYRPLSTAAPFSVLLKEPGKVLNYSAIVDSEGNLLLAGYYHENKTVTIGETQAKGVWAYRSDLNEVKASAFPKTPSDFFCL